MPEPVGTRSPNAPSKGHPPEGRRPDGHPPDGRTGRGAFLGGAAAVLAAAPLGAPLRGRSAAGGHVDAPAVPAGPQANVADVHAFTRPDGPSTVTFAVDVPPAPASDVFPYVNLPHAGP